MKTAALQCKLRFAWLTLPLLMWGCASPGEKAGVSISPGPGNVQRAADFGTIGVIATTTLPKFSFQRPMTSGEAGDRWAGNMVDAGIEITKIPYGGLVGIPLIGLGPIFGKAAGGLAGVPTARFAKADAALEKCIHTFNLQDELRARVADGLGRQGGQSVLVEKPFPSGDRKELTQMSCLMAGTLAWLPSGVTRVNYLSGQGAKTVLELRLIHPGLRGRDGVNPPLALCVEVEARLGDVASGRALAACTVRYRSEAHKFSKWGADDAQLLREELKRCCESAGEAIGKQLLIGNGVVPNEVAWNNPQP